MKILVIVEHDNKFLKESTLHAIFAAKELNGKIDLFVAGFDCKNANIEASKIDGVNTVIAVDHKDCENFVAENISSLIFSIAKEYDYILAAATTFGKNVMPKVAAYFDVEQISDVTKIVEQDTFVRPVYAGNAIATFKSIANKKILTMRATAFDKVEITNDKKAEIKNFDYDEILNRDVALFKSEIQDDDNDVENNLSETLNLFDLLKLITPKFIKKEQVKYERPELVSAKIVIACGRGVQNKEGLELIENLADKLNAAIGATRALVDIELFNNDYQIGQTGKIIAPDLYIGIGISGAIQHVAGIKDSKIIVAINKDEDAAIFQVADYGIVGDLFEIVPEMIDLLSSDSNNKQEIKKEHKILEEKAEL